MTSGPFQQSHRRQRFLEYIVSEALEGRIDRLKGYTIGIEIFDKPTSFDPLTDPIVRVEAARLRDKLREYYETEGQSDPVRITRSDQRVSDEIMASLRSHFTDDAIVDLTGLIAFQNMSSKFNSALEVPAQGFCTK